MTLTTSTRPHPLRRLKAAGMIMMARCQAKTYRNMARFTENAVVYDVLTDVADKLDGVAEDGVRLARAGLYDEMGVSEGYIRRDALVDAFQITAANVDTAEDAIGVGQPGFWPHWAARAWHDMLIRPPLAHEKPCALMVVKDGGDFLLHHGDWVVWNGRELVGMTDAGFRGVYEDG